MADWQKGDLALCVKQGPWRGILVDDLRLCRMRGGMIATVRGVGDYRGAPILWFEGFPGECTRDAFHAIRFRKITPGADIEGIEVERRVPVREDA